MFANEWGVMGGIGVLIGGGIKYINFALTPCH